MQLTFRAWVEARNPRDDPRGGGGNFTYPVKKISTYHYMPLFPLVAIFRRFPAQTTAKVNCKLLSHYQYLYHYFFSTETYTTPIESLLLLNDQSYLAS
jgi:hypothetical protein